MTISQPRRNFLQALPGATAAPVLARAVAPNASWLPPGRGNTKKNRLWKTALGLRGFEYAAKSSGRAAFPIWEILDFAAQQGFDGIELTAQWPMGGLPRAKESDRVRALRRLYEGFGLQMMSLPVEAGPAFHPDAAQRAAWIDEVEDRVALAKSLGCAHITLSLAGSLAGGTLFLATQFLVDNLHRAAESAASAGIVAAFEVEPSFVFNTEKQLIDIHQAINHANMKIIFDPSHFDVLTGGQGRPHEMLKRVGPKNIAMVRLADSDGSLTERGGTSRHLPIGEGHSRPQIALELLKSNGFRGWIIADTHRMADPFAAARKAKSAVDQLAGGA